MDDVYKLTGGRVSVVPVFGLDCGRILKDGRTCPGRIALFKRDGNGMFHLIPAEALSYMGEGVHVVETLHVKPGYSLQGRSVDDIQRLHDRGIVYWRREDRHIDAEEAVASRRHDLDYRAGVREHGGLIRDEYRYRLTCPVCGESLTPSIEETGKAISQLAGILETLPEAQWGAVCEAQGIALEGRRWPESDADGVRVVAGSRRHVHTLRSPGTPVIDRARLMEIIKHAAKHV